MPSRNTCWPAAVAIATLVVLTALACAPGNGPDAPNESMTINRIAYIDSNGQLVTVNPDGSDRSTLTAGEVAESLDRMGGVMAQPTSETRLYGWPVWSPDGSRIAVSLISGRRPSEAEMSVQSLESSNGVGGPVFVNSAPLTIADGTPHYVQWSPDSQRLGVTAATPEGLTLYVVDANSGDGEATPAAAMPVVRGAPLYFDWSPDSRSLAVHSGEQLSVLRLNDDATGFTAQPISRSRSFRTPAWSPDGTTLAWSAPGGRQRSGLAGQAGRDGLPSHAVGGGGGSLLIFVVVRRSGDRSGRPAGRRIARLIDGCDWWRRTAAMCARCGRMIGCWASSGNRRGRGWRGLP